MGHVSPREHIERAEELIVEAEVNVNSYNNEYKTEKGHAQATLALAHIAMARALEGL